MLLGQAAHCLKPVVTCQDLIRAAGVGSTIYGKWVVDAIGHHAAHDGIYVASSRVFVVEVELGERYALWFAYVGGVLCRHEYAG